jgi:tetratricopeptide (TPR) repeat protein
MFCLTKNGKTLVGNNEDWMEPYAKIWTVPSQPDNYGGVYYGWSDDSPQGGMNEKGLVYDAFAMEYHQVTLSKHKKKTDPFEIIKLIMSKCATIKEVISILDQYDLSILETGQLMFVDKTGASIIVEGDVIHYKEGDYQISTNFLLSQVKDKEYPCERYNTCNKMLPESNATIESFKNILKAAHQKGFTQYSNIYEPNEGLIYLYLFHNYEDAVVIDVKEEIKKKPKSIFMETLFTPNPDFITAKSEFDNSMRDKFIAIKKDPKANDPMMIVRFAGSYNRKNKIKEAFEVLKFSVKAYPDSYWPYAGLGDMYQNIGNEKQALKYYKKAINRNQQTTELDKQLYYGCLEEVRRLSKMR